MFNNNFPRSGSAVALATALALLFSACAADSGVAAPTTVKNSGSGIAAEAVTTLPTIVPLNAAAASRIALQLTEAFNSEDLAIVESLLENGGRWVGINRREYDGPAAVAYLQPLLDGIAETHPPEAPFVTARGFAFRVSETLASGIDIKYVLVIEQSDSGALLITERLGLPDDATSPEAAESR